jgi:uncharacterized protein (TIGR03084 family)
MTSHTSGPSSAFELSTLVHDLGDEQSSLEEIVRDLLESQWELRTPSPGWTVKDQICHLTYFDYHAALAIRDPAAFDASLAELTTHALNEGLDNYTLSAYRVLTPHELLHEWRGARESLLRASATLDGSTRIAWYGPSMSARSFVSARLMETWAHGHDVATALGVTREPTKRLRHVAQLGYLTRRWSYQVRGETAPEHDVRVELDAPENERWTWGSATSDDVVRGSAEEFCLVVTQRRHLDDTALRYSPLAREWLIRAQAFAGAPSTGPEPRSSS